MEYKIMLTGEEKDLEILLDVFNEGEPYIEKEKNSYYLRSLMIDKIPDYKIAQNMVDKNIAFLNGALKLNQLSNGKISGFIDYYLRDDGSRHSERNVTCFVEVCSSSIQLVYKKEDGTEVKYNSRYANLNNLLEKANCDESVSKVLELISSDFKTWSGLYKIYEVINKDSNIVDNGWSNLKEVRNFKHTANSPGAIGDKARHGVESSPPQNPMKLKEARNFIDKIVRKWLETK